MTLTTTNKSCKSNKDDDVSGHYRHRTTNIERERKRESSREKIHLLKKKPNLNNYLFNVNKKTKCFKYIYI